MTITKFVLLVFSVGFFAMGFLTKEKAERIMCIVGYAVTILGIVLESLWG